MGCAPIRTDAGMTRLESALVTYLLIAGLVIGAGMLYRANAFGGLDASLAPVSGSVPEAGDAPLTVSVASPGRIAQSPGSGRAERRDECAGLPGRQQPGFDCSLPLYVRALDFSAVRIKARYQCADSENYQLVHGQRVESGKRCVLTSAREGRP